MGPRGERSASLRSGLHAGRRGQDLIAPPERFRQQVAAEQHVGGNAVRDCGIGAPRHHVFARRLQVVVGDGVGTGPVPDRDRLRVRIDAFDVGDVAVANRGGAAVESDPSLLPLVLVAVDVDVFQRQIVRGRCGGVVAQHDQRFVTELRRAVELHVLDPVAVRARLGPQQRRRLQLPSLAENAWQ